MASPAGAIAGGGIDPFMGHSPGGLRRAFTWMDKASLVPLTDPVEWDETVFANGGHGETGRWLAEVGLMGAVLKIVDTVFMTGPLPQRVLEDGQTVMEGELNTLPQYSLRPNISALAAEGREGLIMALVCLGWLGDQR